MADLSAHGIEVEVPPGWDGEIYRRSAGLAPQSTRITRNNPVVHMANFPLIPSRGDFGSGAVEGMVTDDLFIVLFEYGPESVGTALFGASGIPAVSPDDFSPNATQLHVAGQSGAQYFFTDAGRAFCLYVVLGSHARRRQLVPVVNQVLGTLSLSSN